MINQILRSWLRSFGYDFVKYPFQEYQSFRAHLLSLFSKLGINCVLDVGAHRGEYAQFLRNLGYKEFIISFEPVKENFKELIKLSAQDRKWNIYPLALGDKDGVMPMHVTSDTHFSSFLPPRHQFNDFFGGGNKVRRIEEIEMKRLDDIWSQCIPQNQDSRVYLKMDTQGYDLSVLGGINTRHLSSVLALQSEMSIIPIYEGMPDFLKSICFLRKMGFNITGLFPVCRDNDLCIIEFDCVMINSKINAKIL